MTLRPRDVWSLMFPEMFREASGLSFVRGAACEQLWAAPGAWRWPGCPGRNHASPQLPANDPKTYVRPMWRHRVLALPRRWDAPPPRSTRGAQEELLHLLDDSSVENGDAPKQAAAAFSPSALLRRSPGRGLQQRQAPLEWPIVRCSGATQAPPTCRLGAGTPHVRRSHAARAPCAARAPPLPLRAVHARCAALGPPVWGVAGAPPMRGSESAWASRGRRTDGNRGSGVGGRVAGR